MGDEKAVFLDRDGTLIEDKGYITVPEMIQPLPGAAEAIVSLRSKGWKIIVVTNQAQVAKGLISQDELEGINQRLVMMLGAEGARIDGVYFCPHHPDGTEPEFAVECDCRKPKAGMLEQAARDHDLDLSRCVMVGDSLRDVQAGKAAEVSASILVLTGLGAEAAKKEHGADHVAADVKAAVEWIASR